MKPAPFRYHRPGTLGEALALLAEHGSEAKPLAGGQSLIPAMNFRLARPAVLVDLNRIEKLAGVREERGGLRIGTMTRQRTAERSGTVRTAAPLLHEAMPWIAHAQIRNRGTVGGSLAHADPASELPAVMLALNARLLLRDAGGERWVPTREFYTGLFATALRPGELLVEIEIPAAPKRAGWAFEEVSRRHGDYALVGVAAGVELDRKGRCAEARVALFSVGDGPVEAAHAAGCLAGAEPGEDAIREAAELAATRDIDPPSDIHASAAYRRQLARVLTARALTRAFERATGAA